MVNRKRQIRKLLYSRPMVFILLLAVLWVGKAAWGVYLKERDSRQKLGHTMEELAALKTRQVSLQEKIDRFKTEQGVEAEIREQFPVAKPGERMVVIVEDQATPKPKPAPSLVSKFFDIFR